MKIQPLTQDRLEEAAELFIQKFKHLREVIPILPDNMEDKSQVISRLESMVNQGRSLAAVEDNHLVGYLVWFINDDFRGTGRKAAYCPEWGHAAKTGQSSEIYLSMYRQAAHIWSQLGCKTHAITYYTNDRILADFLFWNGFGLTVVDAVREINFNVEHTTTLAVRRAQLSDAGLIALLDKENSGHYSRPPTLMAVHQPNSVAEIAEFLSQQGNSYWLAEAEGLPAGFMRFEEGSAAPFSSVRSPNTMTITGAYTRPQFRGRGAATTLLQAALRAYAEQGYQRCSVDFESLNPEASAFWLKYFEPVCYSAIRYPEFYL